MRCVAPLRAWMYSERSEGGKAVLLVSGRVRYDGRGDPSHFGNDHGQVVHLRCGQCVTCLRERARQWAVRCAHERELVERACFITLTYDEDHVPYGGSLVKEHFQKFMRRLRKEFPNEKIRFLACGEYGAVGQRPHYHAVLFGVDFVEDRYVCGRRGGRDVYRSDCLERLWSSGRSEVGSASFESAAYVAGYVTKKLGERALVGREPEFILMSLKPGLGEGWFRLYGESVVARDSVVVDGLEQGVPRYYDKLLAKWSPGMYEELRARRQAQVVECDPDEVEGRLAAIEEVMMAKVNLFAREVEV